MVTSFAGAATCTFKYAEGVEASLDFTIEKVDSVITAAPTPADLVYDGTAQNLINAGTATGGEMQYSLDGTNYSSAIPTGTVAKTYTVWYKVVGDENHNDTEPASIEVTIAPKTVEISSVTAINRAFDGTNTVEISEVIIEGILVEDEDKVLVSATAAIDSINAGEYIIVDLSNIALTGSANYSIAASAENVPLTTAVTISKADAPTLPSGSKAYVYSIGYEGESVSISGLPTDCGEVEYSLLSVSSDMFENVSVDSRSGKITYDVKELDSYTEDLQGIISVNVMMENYETAIYTLTITRTEKIPQNISAEDITLTYGDADATISVTGAKTGLTYEVISDSNDNGDVVTVDANGKVSIENAGTAIIKIATEGSDDYSEAECEITVTVDKRLVNVPAKDSTVYTYTGKEQTYRLASSPYYTIENATHTNVGKYEVSVTLNDNCIWNGDLPIYEFEIKPARPSGSGSSSTTTNPPSTQKPSTEEPSTEEPSTEEPSTEDSSTEDLSTEEPGTSEEDTVEWKTDENGTFYEKEDGTKVTGWYEMAEDVWYYFDENGYRQTGWEKDGENWYYLNENGVMQTGWVKDGESWYYLSESGAMKTGWVKDGESWYYLSESGAMKTGWVQIGADWFYLNSNGSMAADTYIGKWYVDKNGYYIPSKTK